MNFHVLCIKSIWRQYICSHLIKVLSMFTRVLFGPVNSRFPIEFTKAFSQLSLYKYQFFFVNVKVFYIHNVFWLIRPCSFFRNVRFFFLVFFVELCYLYIMIFIIIYRVKLKRNASCDCYFLLHSRWYVLSYFFNNLNRKKSTLNSIKQSFFIKAAFQFCKNWKSAYNRRRRANLFYKACF